LTTPLAEAKERVQEEDILAHPGAYWKRRPEKIRQQTSIF
jgi:hypothetical protein